ncbi:hypothetical protein [Pseudomonas sp.]|uniref:hypothetical protein n=1 Tax=Pseudomonas sp. TaxID=306 RepID=UPI002C174BBD|nr:hypothetical protein [Pseudomonas sp.]HUE93669.1 hypothetical protein [Pseudomonas sp.]
MTMTPFLLSGGLTAAALCNDCKQFSRYSLQPLRQPMEKIRATAADSATTGLPRNDGGGSDGIRLPVSAVIGDFPPHPKPRWRLIAIS